jgi:tetratricopeptide (TPR) repeat protein
MNAPEHMLYLAVMYVFEAFEALLRAVGKNSDPWTQSAERRELKDKLAAVRDLLAELERDYPGTSVVYQFDDGSEVTYSVARARAFAYNIEAHTMWRFYEDRRAAIDLVERGIAIQPEDETLHCTLAGCYAELGEFAKAIDAMERVISLNPDDQSYRAALDRMQRQQAEAPTARPEPTFSFWRPSTWMS